jgi:hypothetical protein
MEYIYEIGREVLLVPVWALIQSPFIRMSAKVAATSAVSLRGAFMLGLITGTAALVISLLSVPLYGLIGDSVATVFAWMAAIFATVWLYGYFLRGEGDKSIGFWRGALVFALGIVMLAAVMFAVALLVVSTESLWS